MEDLVSRIKRIGGQVADLTQAGALFGCPEFVEVHAQPEGYLEEALGVLGTTQASEFQKAIAALSMQRLPLQKFVEFSEQVLISLEAGRLSQRVFETAVFPTYDWNTMLAENFSDPAVQRLLNRVLASPAVGQVRKAIVRDQILSGKSQQAVLELREAGQIP